MSFRTIGNGGAFLRLEHGICRMENKLKLKMRCDRDDEENRRRRWLDHLT